MLSPEILDHSLNKHFPDLLKFESIADAEASEVYRLVRADAERILGSVVGENLSSAAPASDIVRTAAWNIERGCVFDGILSALKEHDGLRGRDLLLLSELDHGMARSGNRFVAREIAVALEMN